MTDDGNNRSVYDLAAMDPQSLLIDRQGMEEQDLALIGQLMTALGRLRDAENRLSEASLRYMKLNRNDMRALQYLIAMSNRDELATPRDIANHLNISTASTTKLLDRLEKGGHVTREPHPTDRRALAISITPETHQAALNTMGKQQARRFHAAARLTREERETVIRFLNDMTQEIMVGVESWTDG